MGYINRLAKRGSCVLATTIFALTALWTAPVAAQAELVIEQITVTARKKDETLQDVPLSITVLGSQMLEDARIQNLADVSAFTPGLSLFNPQGEFLTTPVIRGMAPTDIFGETNAAVFLDGVLVAGREGLNFSFLEIERIEVVKGPQTALYGRNAFSGAINFITKKPTDEFDSKVEVMAGNDGRVLGKFNVSGPIVGETLTGRLGLAYDNFDGSYTDTTGGTDVGGYEYQTLNASLNWAPTDNLNFMWHVYLSDDEINAAAMSSLTMNCENDIFANAFPDDRPLAFCGDIPNLGQANAQLGIGDDEVINKAPGVVGEEREITRSSLHIDWDLDFGTFTFLTGYSRTEQESITDFTRNLGESLPMEYCMEPLPGNVFGFPTCAESDVMIFGSGILNVELPEETEEWSQEIRFSSRQDQAFRYSVGGSYYDTDNESGGGWAEGTNFIPAGGRTGNFFDFGRPGDIVPHEFVFSLTTPPLAQTIFGNVYGETYTQAGVDRTRISGAANSFQNDRKGWRLFGLAEWDFTEAWTLELQIGYTDEEQEFLDIIASYDFTVDPPTLETNTFSGKDSWDYVDGRVGLKYSVSADWMVYGSIATSTKPGALETISGEVIMPANAVETHVNTVGNEELTAYEIGAKGTVWDGRLVLDGAVFYNDWTDVTLRESIDVDPNTGVPYVQPQAKKVNGGDVTIWGVEFSADARFNERWSGRLAVGYHDAEWDNGTLDSLFEYPSFGGPQCFDANDEFLVPTPPECANNLAGQTLHRQPALQGALSLTYRRPVFGDWEWFTRGDLTYEDSWHPQDDNMANISEHTFLNLSLGFTSDRWTITAWANNLLEEDDPIAAFRDIYFSNTDDVSQSRPLVGRGLNQIVPFRYSVTHPRLTTYGLTVQVRFGAASN